MARVCPECGAELKGSGKVCHTCARVFSDRAPEDKQARELSRLLVQRRRELSEAIEKYVESLIPKWEYLQCSDKDFIEAGRLDTLGLRGWELVGVSTYEEGRMGMFTVHTLYIFKRRIIEEIPSLPDKLLEEFRDIPEIESEVSSIVSSLMDKELRK